MTSPSHEGKHAHTRLNLILEKLQSKWLEFDMHTSFCFLSQTLLFASLESEKFVYQKLFSSYLLLNLNIRDEDTEFAICFSTRSRSNLSASNLSLIFYSYAKWKAKSFAAANIK